MTVGSFTQSGSWGQLRAESIGAGCNASTASARRSEGASTQPVRPFRESSAQGFPAPRYLTKSAVSEDEILQTCRTVREKIRSFIEPLSQLFLNEKDLVQANNGLGHFHPQHDRGHRHRLVLPGWSYDGCRNGGADIRQSHAEIGQCYRIA